MKKNMKKSMISRKTFLKAGLLVLAVFALYFLFTVDIASANVGNWYQDPFGIRSFVNSKGFAVPSSWNGQGALNFDSATAKKVCQLAGYDDATSMDCPSSLGSGCGFTSCQDNVLAKWNSSSNNFDIINACTAGNRWISSLTCKNNAPVCTSHASKKCVGNNVYWFNSCNAQEEQFQACGANQICQNAQCVNIVCSSNSDCGTNGYIGSPYCQGGDVYQNYRTYTCQNPGTTYSSCSNSTAPQLKQNCASNQICSNGNCTNINITCSSNANCGVNGYTGSPYCQGNSVYQNFRTWTCNNPGTANSFCSSSNTNQLVSNCTGNQTCSNGSCINVNIACSTNSDCGTNGYTGSPYCQGNSVYQNFRTWTCNNPGTANSTCSNSTATQLKQNCASNQICSNGSCTNVNITCSSNSDCGTNGYTGNPYCQGGDVYQNYITYTCNNPGTANSTCSNSTAPQLKQNCASNQICSNGNCTNVNITCSSNSDCGTNGYTGNPYCQGNNVYQNYITYTCNNPGTSYSSCSNSTASQLKQNCASNQICSNGSCTLNCTSHYNQRCVGNAVYWFDSCGRQQDLVKNCSYGCQYSQCINYQPTYIKHYRKSCNNGNLYWYDSNGAPNDLYKNCSDNNQCTADGCANNQCVNQTRCDSSTCAVGSADYCSACNHVGDGVCNCDETPCSAPNDCKASTGGGLDTSTFCEVESTSANWSKNITVSAGQTINCLIVIKNTSATSINDVAIRADIPGEIVSTNELKVDGMLSYGYITSGINLGSFAPNASKTISFTGKAQSPINQFSAKQLIGIASSGALSSSDSLVINFQPAVAGLATASLESSSFVEFFKRWYIWILIAIVLIFLFIVIFRRLSSSV